MNTRAVRAIVRKDLKVVVQSKAVLVPLIVVPLIFLIVLPAGVALLAKATETGDTSTLQMQQFLKNLPPTLETSVAGFTEAQKIVVLMIMYMLAPMYLIVPLMVASVIAADSFAGEKERKTLEGLLYTPTTDFELLFAKCLAAWLPALCVSFGGFIVYGIVANLAAWPIMERVFFPNLMWVVLVIWVSPAAAGLGLSAMVLVSSRVQTFQESYQLGATVVLPVLLLVIGQATGVIYFSLGLVLLLGLVLWIIDAALLWIGGNTFRRSEILARL